MSKKSLVWGSCLVLLGVLGLIISLLVMGSGKLTIEQCYTYISLPSLLAAASGFFILVRAIIING